MFFLSMWDEDHHNESEVIEFKTPEEAIRKMIAIAKASAIEAFNDAIDRMEINTINGDKVF